MSLVAPATPLPAGGGWRIDLSVPVDLRATVGAHRVGGRDPVTVVDATGVWRATRTPDGPATVHLRSADGAPHRSTGTMAVSAEAWGPGADWALAQAPALLGASDTSPFAPPPGLVADLHRRQPALRLGRSGNLVETILPTILEQKVTTGEAHRSYHGLVRAFGEPAPGPAGARGLRLGPDPARLAELTYFDLHRFGIERKRADTLLRVCRYADRLRALEAAAGPDGESHPVSTPDDTGPTGTAPPRPPTTLDHLRTIRGIGPWTLAIVAQKVLGDPDAVIVGDYHLPNLVSWNLAGEPRADDARMLELLEPFAGHRGRVVRLLGHGAEHAPRFGPKKARRDFSRF